MKILSHENYTFYNPRLHPEFTAADSPILIFEGTYTATFADRCRRRVTITTKSCTGSTWTIRVLKRRKSKLWG